MRFTFITLYSKRYFPVDDAAFIAEAFGNSEQTFKATQSKTLNRHDSATLEQVLEIAGLIEPYDIFVDMFNEAERMFVKHKNRDACDVLYKIWMDPKIIPALLLYECYYARELILPNWKDPCVMHYYLKHKSSGGTRPIIVPDKSARICMGVINLLLQTSCLSWSNRTYGFRLETNTANAIKALCTKAQQVHKISNSVIVVSFDIKGAFNAVNVQHAFQTLDLKNLPHPVKTFVWNWQKTMPYNVIVPGLKQGVPYSPTLFAWYIDQILVRHSDLFCYADNFAGVFPTMSAANDALLKATEILHKHGMSINFDSIYKKEVYYNQVKQSVHFKWLGHVMHLPSPTISLNKAICTTNTYKAPLIITKDQWAKMLHQTDWLNNVLAKDWRNL